MVDKRGCCGCVFGNLRCDVYPCLDCIASSNHKSVDEFFRLIDQNDELIAFIKEEKAAYEFLATCPIDDWMSTFINQRKRAFEKVIAKAEGKING